MKKSISLAAITLVMPLTAVAAQQRSAAEATIFRPGVRVRLSVPYRPTERIIVGTVEATRPDTLVLDTADTWRERRSLFPSAVRVDEFRHIHLPLSTVDSVEVSRGRSRFLGALKGGTQGAVVAGIVVGLASISGHSNPRFADFTTGLSAGAIAGTVIGVPIGYLFGVERWRTVHLPKRNHTPRLATAGGSAGTPTP